MDPKDQAVLQSIGRNGWSVVSKQPSTEYTAGTYPGERIPKYPEGSEQWVITDGKGHNQTMVVKPPADYPGPYSSNVNDPGAYNPNPTVIDPPKDLPASDTPPPRNVQTSVIGGVTYEHTDEVQPDGTHWKKVDVAGNAPSNANKPPSDPSKWTQIHENPADPTSRVIALQDPVTGDRVAVSTNANKPPSDPSKWVPINGPDGKPIALQDPVTGDRVAVPAGPTKKSGTEDSVSGSTVYHWSYDENGNPHLTGKEAVADPNKIPDGTKTYIPAAGGWGIPAVYKNGTAMATGETAVPLTPDAAAKPTGGTTRDAIMDGYHVTQTFSGGDWVTTNVGTRATPQNVQQVSAPADQQNLTTYDPNTGAYNQTPNQNYQPKDVASRVQQLQQQAQSKRDALNKDVQSGQKTADQAATEFDTWWSTNIDPQTQQLQQAQQTAVQDATIKQNAELRDQAAAERSAFTTAQTAGTNAVDAAKVQMPYMVGPGFGAAVNKIAGAYASGKPVGNLDIGSAVTFDMPDFSSIAQKATADALAHLSPTAAGLAGKPMPDIPQGVDIGAALNRSNYRPGTTTIAPDGTVTIAHTQPTPAAAPAPDPFGTYRPPQLAPALGPASGPLYG